MIVEGRRIDIRGTVQGVGFRPWVYRLATGLGVRGSVLNDGRGVAIEAFASPEVLDAFLAALRAEPPPAACIDELAWGPSSGAPSDDFVIAPSRESESHRPSIPPDLATCPGCLREVFDPTDRRHGYAFTNCTNCGPRFSIARDVPYDRPATTMRGFAMCEACLAEYRSVGDRRFHAQPNACPECGPRLTLVAPDGTERPAQSPLAEAAAALEAGAIVAIKGLGGYHLACDARRDDVVRELRRRKRRDEKPFAVMVRDLAAARELAEIDETAAELLASTERPIVLLPGRQGSDLAPSVAPDSARVGLFLPYTPLHHLLLEAVGRPLVMTSGNISDAPIAYRDADAIARLGGIADLFLRHDRPIENRADDSVAVVLSGAPVVLRRARGYVPRPVRLRRPVARPVLACGGDLKNVFCLASDDQAFLGPHIGDLEDWSTYESFEASVARLERFTGIEPQVVAHDLHPRYHSTRYARARRGVEVVAVQHHHAHIVSAMAERGIDGPVLGLAWDGTGYGSDGTAWGAELLLVEPGSFERLATARPIALAGGDKAIRQVWRTALAVLDDAFGEGAPIDRLALFDAVSPEAIRVTRQMVARGLNSPLARGMGRYFDALGAIGLGRRRASYEGQVAIAWEQAAEGRRAAAYGFAVDQRDDPWTLDLRRTVRQAVSDLLDGRSPSIVSARFHQTLVEAGLELVAAAAVRWGAMPVVLSGGCFQNALLTEGLVRGLQVNDSEVIVHRRVPPNDGGLALGQAVIADALLSGA